MHLPLNGEATLTSQSRNLAMDLLSRVSRTVVDDDNAALAMSTPASDASSGSSPPPSSLSSPSACPLCPWGKEDDDTRTMDEVANNPNFISKGVDDAEKTSWIDGAFQVLLFVLACLIVLFSFVFGTETLQMVYRDGFTILYLGSSCAVLFYWQRFRVTGIYQVICSEVAMPWKGQAFLISVGSFSFAYIAIRDIVYADSTEIEVSFKQRYLLVTFWSFAALIWRIMLVWLESICYAQVLAVDLKRLLAIINNFEDFKRAVDIAANKVDRFKAKYQSTVSFPALLLLLFMQGTLVDTALNLGKKNAYGTASALSIAEILFWSGLYWFVTVNDTLHMFRRVTHIEGPRICAATAYANGKLPFITLFGIVMNSAVFTALFIQLGIIVAAVLLPLLENGVRENVNTFCQDPSNVNFHSPFPCFNITIPQP